MSASLKTTNYQLPYFSPTDFTDWAAYNDSVNKIDLQMKTNADSTEQVGTQTAAIQESVETLTTAVQKDQQDIVKNASAIQQINSNITLINQQATQQKQELDNTKVIVSSNSDDINTLKQSIPYMRTGEIYSGNPSMTGITSPQFTTNKAVVEKNEKLNMYDITVYLAYSLAGQGSVAKNPVAALFPGLKLEGSSSVNFNFVNILDITLDTSISNLNISTVNPNSPKITETPTFSIFINDVTNYQEIKIVQNEKMNLTDTYQCYVNIKMKILCSGIEG